MRILSPEGHGGIAGARLAPGLESLNQSVIGLHHNSKPGAPALLAGIGEWLTSKGAGTRLWSKPHAARPSHHIEEMAATFDAAVVALGD